MPEALRIPDAHLFPLERRDGRLRILDEQDHLLRRFGALEAVALQPAQTLPFTLRAEADEIWVPLQGAADFALADLRPGSPSHGVGLELSLSADNPQGLLLPFGVACQVSSRTGAYLLRLSTHSAAHPQDRQLEDADLPEGAPR